MKTNLLLVFLFATAVISVPAQTTIHLTFTAEVNGIHQPIDSILIQNLTQGGDTTLYGTDTLLVLDHGIDIEDRMPDHGNRMILYPAYPNPVTLTSTIRLWLPQDGPVTLRLFDLPGRELATFSRSLGSGEHRFTFTPGKEPFYLLVAEAADQRLVQKLISLRPGDGNSGITYTGHQPAPSAMRKGKSAFPWVPGDHLRFVGFSPLGVDTIEDNPVSSALYTFQFLPPGPPPGADFSVSDTLVFVNDTVHFTDLSTGSPTTWKWYFGDGDSSLMQNPSHIYTTSGIYSVTLVVSNAGDADTLTKHNHITVIGVGAYPPGTVHCNPANPTAVVDIINPITGKIWMDRNLGAAQTATSSIDPLANGDLYQWGRFADGHQCRNSTTNPTLSTTHLPGHGSFIVAPYYPNDWMYPQNTNLWQGVNGVNNPCPVGYRLPTGGEWNDERLSWISSNAAGAFSSPLKLPIASFRSAQNGNLGLVGGTGTYWSSTVSGDQSSYLRFSSPSAFLANWERGNGNSVRCLKDL